MPKGADMNKLTTELASELNTILEQRSFAFNLRRSSVPLEGDPVLKTSFAYCLCRGNQSPSAYLTDVSNFLTKTVDGLWKAAVDSVTLELTAPFSIELLHEVIDKFHAENHALDSIFIGGSRWASYLAKPESQSTVEPSTSIEVVMRGILGSISRVPLRTDAFRHPAAQVLSGELYFLAAEAGELFYEEQVNAAKNAVNVEVQINLAPGSVYRINADVA
jgi:hypothetical protein